METYEFDKSAAIKTILDKWAKVSRDLSFTLACSEHGVKAKESKLSADGKAIEAV